MGRLHLGKQSTQPLKNREAYLSLPISGDVQSGGIGCSSLSFRNNKNKGNKNNCTANRQLEDNRLVARQRSSQANPFLPPSLSSPNKNPLANKNSRSRPSVGNSTKNSKEASLKRSAQIVISGGVVGGGLGFEESVQFVANQIEMNPMERLKFQPTQTAATIMRVANSNCRCNLDYGNLLHVDKESRVQLLATKCAVNTNESHVNVNHNGDTTPTARDNGDEIRGSWSRWLWLWLPLPLLLSMRCFTNRVNIRLIPHRNPCLQQTKENLPLQRKVAAATIKLDETSDFTLPFTVSEAPPIELQTLKSDKFLQDCGGKVQAKSQRDCNVSLKLESHRDSTAAATEMIDSANCRSEHQITIHHQQAETKSDLSDNQCDTKQAAAMAPATVPMVATVNLPAVPSDKWSSSSCLGLLRRQDRGPCVTMGGVISLRENEMRSKRENSRQIDNSKSNLLACQSLAKWTSGMRQTMGFHATDSVMIPEVRDKMKLASLLLIIVSTLTLTLTPLASWSSLSSSGNGGSLAATAEFVTAARPIVGKRMKIRNTGIGGNEDDDAINGKLSLWRSLLTTTLADLEGDAAVEGSEQVTSGKKHQKSFGNGNGDGIGLPLERLAEKLHRWPDQRRAALLYLNLLAASRKRSLLSSTSTSDQFVCERVSLAQLTSDWLPSPFLSQGEKLLERAKYLVELDELPSSGKIFPSKQRNFKVTANGNKRRSPVAGVATPKAASSYTSTGRNRVMEKLNHGGGGGGGSNGKFNGGSDKNSRSKRDSSGGKRRLVKGKQEPRVVLEFADLAKLAVENANLISRLLIGGGGDGGTAGESGGEEAEEGKSTDERGAEATADEVATSAYRRNGTRNATRRSRVSAANKLLRRLASPRLFKYLLTKGLRDHERQAPHLHSLGLAFLDHEFEEEVDLGGSRKQDEGGARVYFNSMFAPLATLIESRHKTSSKGSGSSKQPITRLITTVDLAARRSKFANSSSYYFHRGGRSSRANGGRQQSGKETPAKLFNGTNHEQTMTNLPPSFLAKWLHANDELRSIGTRLAKSILLRKNRAKVESSKSSGGFLSSLLGVGGGDSGSSRSGDQESGNNDDDDDDEDDEELYDGQDGDPAGTAVEDYYGAGNSTWSPLNDNKNREDDDDDDNQEQETSWLTLADGRWFSPYFDCGLANRWLLTYSVPFFGSPSFTGSDEGKYLDVWSDGLLKFR